MTVARCLLRGEVGILVLCHTLSNEDVDIIAAFHKEMGSAALLLCLSFGAWNAIPNDGLLCNVCKGPAAFLGTVAQLNNASRLSA